ncbi:saccharopine dehydrogenase-like oxidoreductase [Apostichopus japonicus]|uniref:saccharopine dehydrogenase-like oxidoreductase n=1 Tax=Stichopus japonicus TaxID=307972 RepID=UPI003AB5D321
MAAKKFDIIVFGATGFTGKHCVKELAEVWDENPDLKWAVAGRSMEKLRSVVVWAAEKSGRDLKQVEYVCADIQDDASLNSMCQQGKLILNLVGPYHFYAMPVIQACVKNKCHHIDISGEIQFLERLQLEYHEKAKEAGIYMVESCGFDSIPADMGVIYAKKMFPGILNSVESYLSSKSGPEGSKFNFGTLNSGMNVVSHFREIQAIRNKLHPTPLPTYKPKLKVKNRVFYSDFCERWSVVFSGSDVPNVERSQRYLYEKENQRPIQYAAYATEKSLAVLLGIILVVVNLAIFAFFRCGRKLIEKYPGAFTFGAFSHEGPSDAQMAGTSFNFKFRGRGFSSEAVEKTEKEDMEIITQVDGPEMAYVATPIVMVQSALTILQEADKLPERGGVYTPAAAFYKTTLIDRCHQHGVKFSVTKPAYKL